MPERVWELAPRLSDTIPVTWTGSSILTGFLLRLSAMIATITAITEAVVEMMVRISIQFISLKGIKKVLPFFIIRSAFADLLS